MRSQLKGSAAFFLFMLAGIVGCGSSPPVTENDLLGLYVVKAREITDSLRLNPGGSFQHHLWDNAGLAISERGSWAPRRSRQGDNTIEFRNISTPADGFSPRVPRRGAWITTVGRDRSGNVTITINADLGLAYTHIN